MTAPTDTLGRLRRWILALFTLGVVGTGSELFFFEHFEDIWQAIPIGLMTVSLGMVFWNAVAPSRTSVRLFRIVLAAFVVAGILGMYLHFQGNLQFQIEMDPAQDRWTLFQKVIHAKSPPSLAPGSMAQLGLLGLLWSFRHPALHKQT
jgi:hypothetical protein